MTNKNKWLNAVKWLSNDEKTATVEWTDKEGNKKSKDYTTCQAEVFAGGTCGKSEWRDGEDGFLAKLKELGIKVFDPRVSPWEKGDSQIETEKKKVAKIQVYGISKEQAGSLTPYEIGRMVDATLRGEKALLCVVLYGDKEYWEKNAVTKDYAGAKEKLNELLKTGACDNEVQKELINSTANLIGEWEAADRKVAGHTQKSYAAILADIKAVIENFIEEHNLVEDADSIRNRFIIATSTDEAFSDVVE